jgi:hypothetical protein
VTAVADQVLKRCLPDDDRELPVEPFGELPVEPFRAWLERLLVEATRDRDDGTRIVLDWTGLTTRRLYSYRYHNATVRESRVDASCSREGGVHLNELYPVVDARLAARALCGTDTERRRQRDYYGGHRPSPAAMVSAQLGLAAMGEPHDEALVARYEELVGGA